MSLYCLLMGLQGHCLSGAYATVRCIVVTHNADQTCCLVFRKFNTSEHALCNTFRQAFKQRMARYEDPVL